jgi:hypothetical protein
MIYLNINQVELLTEIVAELTKLGMSVSAELRGTKWCVEVSK